MAYLDSSSSLAVEIAAEAFFVVIAVAAVGTVAAAPNSGWAVEGTAAFVGQRTVAADGKLG